MREYLKEERQLSKGIPGVQALRPPSGVFSKPPEASVAATLGGGQGGGGLIM